MGSKKKHIVRAVINKVIHIEEDVEVKLLLTDEEMLQFTELSAGDQAAWLRDSGALPFEDILDETDEDEDDFFDELLGGTVIDTIIGDVITDTIEIEAWDGLEGTIQEFGELGHASMTGGEAEELTELLSLLFQTREDMVNGDESLNGLLFDSNDLTDVSNKKDMPKMPNKPDITLQNTELKEDELDTLLQTIIAKGKKGDSE